MLSMSCRNSRCSSAGPLRSSCACVMTIPQRSRGRPSSHASSCCGSGTSLVRPSAYSSCWPAVGEWGRQHVHRRACMCEHVATACSTPPPPRCPFPSMPRAPKKHAQGLVAGTYTRCYDRRTPSCRTSKYHIRNALQIHPVGIHPVLTQHQLLCQAGSKHAAPDPWRPRQHDQSCADISHAQCQLSNLVRTWVKSRRQLQQYRQRQRGKSNLR